MCFSRYSILLAVAIVVFSFHCLMFFICDLRWFAAICGLLFERILCRIFLGFVWFVQFSMPRLVNTAQMEQDLQNPCWVFIFLICVFECMWCVCFVIIPCVSHSCICIIHFFEVPLFLHLSSLLWCFEYVLPRSSCVFLIVQSCSIVFSCLVCPRPRAISTTQTKDRQNHLLGAPRLLSPSVLAACCMVTRPNQKKMTNVAFRSLAWGFLTVIMLVAERTQDNISQLEIDRSIYVSS